MCRRIREHDLLEIFGSHSQLAHGDLYPGRYRALRGLQLADVELGEKHLFGQRERFDAFAHDHVRGQRMALGSQLLARSEDAVGEQHPSQTQLRHDVDQAAAAQALGRDSVAADHLKLHAAVGQHHALDRPLGRPHAMEDLPTLERGTGRGACGHHALLAADRDLAVRADVDQ